MVARPDAATMDGGAMMLPPQPPIRLPIDAGGTPFPPAEPTSTVDLTNIIPEVPPSTATMQSEPLANACGSQCASGGCDDQGHCHECTSDAHCIAQGAPRCFENRCVACREAADCGPDGTCESNTCRAPSRVTCPDGTLAKDGSCPQAKPAPTKSGPACGDRQFDAQEECEIGFGGIPPNVYDETNCDPQSCKRKYWQTCDPTKRNADCPPNATCTFVGTNAFCTPRACPRGEPDCVGALASVPEQCPRMPLYPVVNLSTICFMACDRLGHCPRGLACTAGLCLFPLAPGVISVTRDVK